MLREAVKNQTPVGMEAKGFMDSVMRTWWRRDDACFSIIVLRFYV